MSDSFVRIAETMTPEEYGLALRAIYDGSPSVSDPTLSNLDREFMIDIDYRLGRDFPVERRMFLLDARRLAQDRFKELMRPSLVQMFMPRKWRQRAFDDLQLRLLIVFSTILDPREFKAFTGIDSPWDAKGNNDLNAGLRLRMP